MTSHTSLTIVTSGQVLYLAAVGLGTGSVIVFEDDTLEAEVTLPAKMMVDTTYWLADTDPGWGWVTISGADGVALGCEFWACQGSPATVTPRPTPSQVLAKLNRNPAAITGEMPTAAAAILVLLLSALDSAGIILDSTTTAE